LIRAGEMATRAALPEIRKWLVQPEPARKNPLTTTHPAIASAE
jgi:hypothetical protein